MAAAVESIGGGAGGAGPVRTWKVSCQACKSRWPEQIKVTQAKKGAETFPFPMSVSRNIPRPEKAAAWEVWELHVKLVLVAKPKGATPQMRVECGTDGELPHRAKEAMEAAIMREWNRRSASMVDCLEDLLEWCEASFVELLSSDPVFVSRFIAEKASGGNEWRYCILEPVLKSAAEEEEQELTDEQMAAEAARIERELARAAAADAERQAFAAERRRLAELEGPKPRQLSKKEQEELKAAKRSQGDRTAKSGPRRRKFDPTKDKVGKFDEID
jgi:hypothetical protein